jgi:hypothetical protein
MDNLIVQTMFKGSEPISLDGIIKNNIYKNYVFCFPFPPLEKCDTCGLDKYLNFYTEEVEEIYSIKLRARVLCFDCFIDFNNFRDFIIKLSIEEVKDPQKFYNRLNTE